MVAFTGRFRAQSANTWFRERKMACHPESQNQAELVAAVTAEVLKLLPTLQASHQNTAPVDAQMGGESDQSESDVDWEDVLGNQQAVATTATAKKFVGMLTNPPDLQSLKKIMGQVPLYQGVPETPGPRRNKVDSQLWSAQRKVELAMHLLTHYVEGGDMTTIGSTAAFMRSAWQDLHENRRHYLAGRQSWKLDPRVDDKKPKLLSVEEEKKLRPPREGGAQEHQRGRTQWRASDWNGPSGGKGFGKPKWYQRPRSRSQGKGSKGRGKGQK